MGRTEAGAVRCPRRCQCRKTPLTKVEKETRAGKEERKETRVERAKEEPKVGKEEEASSETCQCLLKMAASSVESLIGP